MSTAAPQSTAPPRVGGLARAKDENQHGYSNILDRLRNLPGKTGSETKFKCCCPVPAHEDRNPSLSVTVADNGTIGLTCFAGCEKPDIVAALDGTMADLFLPKDRPAPKAKRTYSRSQCKFVCAYDYLDENGRLLYQNVRYLDPDGEKKFWPRRPDGADGWIGNLDGVERVLYRLSEVQRAKASGQTIYFCEGEKDADNVAKLGLCSTSIGSSSNSLTPSQIEILTGCDVVILEDNDRAGIAAAQKWSKSLPGSVVVTFRDLPTGGDVSDWIAQGHTVEALQALVEEARTNPVEDAEAENPRALPRFTDMTGSWELADEDIPQLYYEAMPLGELAVIAGEPGSGKTIVATGLALSVVFFKTMVGGFTPCRPGRVALLLSEDAKHPVSKRVKAWCEAHGVTREEYYAATEDGRLSFLCGDSAELLSFEHGVCRRTQAHAELLADCSEHKWDLLVVDSFAEWSGVPKENDNAMMHQAGKALIELAKASGGVVLALCHTNKQSDRNSEAGLSAIRGGGALGGKIRWGGQLLKFSDADLKYYGIPESQRKRYLRFENIKAQYSESGQTTILERGPGGVLKAVDLQPTGKASLLDAIVDELTEKPVNLTAWEMYKSDGQMSVKFRDAVSKRAGGIKAGWRVMQTAINSGLETGALVAKINSQKPDHPFIGAA